MQESARVLRTWYELKAVTQFFASPPLMTKKLRDKSKRMSSVSLLCQKSHSDKLMRYKICILLLTPRKVSIKFVKLFRILFGWESISSVKEGALIAHRLWVSCIWNNPLHRYDRKKISAHLFTTTIFAYFSDWYFLTRCGFLCFE